VSEQKKKEAITEEKYPTKCVLADATAAHCACLAACLAGAWSKGAYSLIPPALALLPAAEGAC
jgi:hypothetical protein